MTNVIMSNIAADMRRCARKLEEFSKMVDAAEPVHHPWSASDLRREADTLERG